MTLLKEHLKTPDTAECARVLDQVEKASARGTALARQLLTFSKGGSPVKAPQDPVELVRESAALALLGSPVVSEIEAPSDLPRVDGDRDQILQVFHNLFLNAVQAMPEGGTVRVRLEARELPPAGAPGAIPGRVIAFTIDDEGPGIPEEILPRIFDPYFTTKPAGTGLGLSTSHSIIQRHGGSLRASRAPGGGARFEIWLPVFSGNVSVPPAAPPQTHATRRARILIMDDDPLIVQLLSTMLTTMGHEVVATHRGDEAVAALEASPDFDLCILDLTIPGGMGGEETMQRLRALKPDLKALVSSGYSDAPILSDPGAYGFLGILPKPYSFRALQTKIAEALG
ncbi:MAG: response regulator [Spirochaetes bacterium]|nr:response regulator [Spirochaetota bacterium]